MIATANESYKYNQWSTIGIIASLVLSCVNPLFLLVTIACIALKVYVHQNGTVDIDYTIDDYQRSIIDERMKPLYKIAQSKKTI